MENLKEELDRVVTFLQPYLSLANSHTVDFIVNDSWRCITPDDIRIKVDSNNVQNVLKDFWYHELDRKCPIHQFLEEAKKYVLESTSFCVNLEKLSLCTRKENIVKVTEFMSDKKQHEVEIMSQFVADVASSSNTSLIVDIGSGKGYLTSVLALQHGLKILGMDCSRVNIKGAAKTTMKLEVNFSIFHFYTNVANYFSDFFRKNGKSTKELQTFPKTSTLQLQKPSKNRALVTKNIITNIVGDRQ